MGATKVNRRSLFGLLLAPLVLPVVALLPRDPIYFSYWTDSNFDSLITDRELYLQRRWSGCPRPGTMVDIFDGELPDDWTRKYEEWL